MSRSPSAPARSPAPTPAASAPRRRVHEVRIIGGQWKRSRLPVPDVPGLRPTPDRVRETLFNWLASLADAGGGALPGWHCIDLFAGTGALGFEAASRGAAAVLLCEQDAALAARLQATRERLQAEAVRVQRGDGVAHLAQLARTAPGTLDLVLLDPPFDQPALYARALQVAAPALRPAEGERAGGVVYLEAAQAWTDDQLAPFGFALRRHLRAGAVHAHLLHAASS